GVGRDGPQRLLGGDRRGDARQQRTEQDAEPGAERAASEGARHHETGDRIALPGGGYFPAAFSAPTVTSSTPPSFTSSITWARMPAVAAHDHGVGGALDVEALDGRAHLAQVDLPPVHPDIAVRADRDQDVAALAVLRGQRLGPVDGDAGLLDEGGGDDEEDQEVEDEVEHRREVDADVLFLALVAHPGASRSSRRAQGDVLDAPLAHLIDDLDDDPGPG